MDTITVEFKYKVGDFVRVKQDKRAYELLPEAERKYNPECQQFMIVERTFNQCYNTTQNHYAIRGHSKDGPKLHSYVEVELEGVE